jgi:DNA processing protein
MVVLTLYIQSKTQFCMTPRKSQNTGFQNSVGDTPTGTSLPSTKAAILRIHSGVVVFEFGSKSGFVIATRKALKQGLAIIAIPSALSNPRSRGGDQLIRSGAILTGPAKNVF